MGEVGVDEEGLSIQTTSVGQVQALVRVLDAMLGEDAGCKTQG